jgi:hypothetical protein
VVISNGESDCPTLYSLEFINVLLLGWAAHSTSTFDGRSHLGGVAPCFDGGWTLADVSAEEDQSGVSHLGYLIDVRIRATDFMDS